MRTYECTIHREHLRHAGLRSSHLLFCVFSRGYIVPVACMPVHLYEIVLGQVVPGVRLSCFEVERMVLLQQC